MYKDTLEDRENAKIDPFKKKESRADLKYVPECKDLKDVVYTGDLSVQENRDILIKVIDNRIKSSI